MRRLVITLEDCRDCPYYERLVGRENLYHTCHLTDRTSKNRYEPLMKYCKATEVK